MEGKSGKNQAGLRKFSLAEEQYGLDALAQISPKLFYVIGLREPAGHADDGNAIVGGIHKVTSCSGEFALP